MSISAEDVLQVAKTIGFKPTTEEVEETQSRFSSYEEENLGETWDTIIKIILNDLKNERDIPAPRSLDEILKEIREKKQKLVDAVMEEMERDFKKGDVTAIDEFLLLCPFDKLLQYLPEEQWENFK